ncbi:MAG: glutathione S-transferase [Pseudomonadota bacterium]
MTYTLFLGDRSYSSWSLRAWLLFEAFELPYRSKFVDFSLEASVAEQLDDPLLRTVPALRLPGGGVLSDSISIAEELASLHPEAGLWPEDPAARAVARNLTAEMHSGFGDLRGDCPMNLRLAYRGFEPSDGVRADLARIEAIWAAAREAHGAGGPWLCGRYSIADAFYAPVAARIATYDLPVGEAGQAYVAAQLAHEPFRRWRAMGLASGETLEWYLKDLPLRDWPGPKPLDARAIETGPSENAACPYSGDPVTHFLALDDRVFGFCNAFCRDKTVADPEAWPKFIALI